MKRCVMIGSTLVPVVLSLGLLGCDSGGVEEGVPKDIPKTAVVPIEDHKVDMVGDTARAKKAAAKDAKTAPTPK